MPFNPVGHELVGYSQLELSLSIGFSLCWLEPGVEGLFLHTAGDVLEAVFPLLGVFDGFLKDQGYPPSVIHMVLESECIVLQLVTASY